MLTTEIAEHIFLKAISLIYVEYMEDDTLMRALKICQKLADVSNICG